MASRARSLIYGFCNYKLGVCQECGEAEGDTPEAEGDTTKAEGVTTKEKAIKQKQKMTQLKKSG